MSDRQPSKEQTALLIRAVWDSLIRPKWKKDDLVDLGKLVYAKLPLREIEPAAFGRLIPYLKEMSEYLDGRLAEIYSTSEPKPAEPSPEPPKPETPDGQ